MIKLNLGCGHKLYPAHDGWVNVDIVVPKQQHLLVDEIDGGFAEVLDMDLVPGVLPVFLKSSLLDMKTVADNVADEVHLYHVIEHLYPQEVPVVLKEILRVLKPGGIVVLEQPDILKCAANLLAGYHSGNQHLANRLGILGIFGQSDPGIPFMLHKWGWMPETLGAVMHEVGYTEIQSNTAQTHYKGDRDFQMVGRKCQP